MITDEEIIKKCYENKFPTGDYKKSVFWGTYNPVVIRIAQESRNDERKKIIKEVADKIYILDKLPCTDMDCVLCERVDELTELIDSLKKNNPT